MKKKCNLTLLSIRNLLFLSISILVLSCEKQDIKPIECPQSKETTVENGYLNFSDENSFSAYLNEIRNEQLNEDGSLKSGTINLSIKGFNSLASKLARFQNNSLKNNSSSTVDDGYFAELQKSLITDDALFQVLDTANRVKIGNEIYQITEAGTFIYSSNDSLEFAQLSDTFSDIYLKYTRQLDSVTYLYGNIKLVDVHGYVKNKNYTIDNVLADVTGDVKSPNLVYAPSQLKSIDEVFDATYTTRYNLVSIKAGAKTFVGKGFQALFGENSWREIEFDNDHRMRVKLFNVNYVGFANSGLKVEFERRIMVTKVIKILGFRAGKVTLWSYWTGANAPEMVLGSDYFKGYTQFEIPIESYYTDINANRSQIEDNIISAAFQGYFTEPKDFLRGWVSNLNIIEGTVTINKKKYTSQEGMLAAFDAGYKSLTKFAKSSIKNGMQELGFHKNEPVMMITPGIESNANREYMFIAGESKYSNKENATSYFGRSPSFGVRVGGDTNSYVPTSYGVMTPNKFTVEEAVMFGAVKYNGVWKGIRMYIE